MTKIPFAHPIELGRVWLNLRAVPTHATATARVRRLARRRLEESIPSPSDLVKVIRTVSTNRLPAGSSSVSIVSWGRHAVGERKLCTLP